MLIQYLIEHPHELDHTDAAEATTPARRRCPGWTGSTRPPARSSTPTRSSRTGPGGRVVDLQAGDPETLALWQQFVDESKIYFYSVYDKLDMEIRGRGHRRRVRATTTCCVETCDLLEKSGVAVRVQRRAVRLLRRHQGQGRRAGPADRAASPTAASATRPPTCPRSATGPATCTPTRCCTSWTPGRRCTSGWSSRPPGGPAGCTDEVTAKHLPFGTVLGKDGKPFKTRARRDRPAGGPARRGGGAGRRRWSREKGAADLTEEEIADARPAGRHRRGQVRRPVDLAGPRLHLRPGPDGLAQRRHQRLPPVRLRPDPVDPAAGPATTTADGRTRSCRWPRPSGRWACSSTSSATRLAAVAETYEPHKLAAYLYQLASAFTTFYDQCPVLKADGPATVENRLFLCDLTARTLARA